MPECLWYENKEETVEPKLFDLEKIYKNTRWELSSLKTEILLSSSLPESPLPEIELWDLLKIDSSLFNEIFDFNKGKIKDWAENLDRKWRYLEINGKKIYSLSPYGDGMYYDFYQNKEGTYSLMIGQRRNGKMEWQWIFIRKDWHKYEWGWKNGKKEWQWTYFWKDWYKYIGQFKDDFYWTWIEYSKDLKLRWKNWKLVE